MEIKIYEANKNMLVVLSGRIVLDECDRLKSTILPAIQPGISQVNLDLSGVDFIDSAGLGALVGIKVSARNKNQARLALLNPSRQVSDILMVSKLDSIFDIITGADADSVVSSLAKPENEKSAANMASSSPSTGAGPAMPSSRPAASAGSSGDAGTPKEKIDKLCREAVEHMRRSDYEAASKCYISALEINPDYLPAHNNLAIVYEKVPTWHPKAIEQWKKVLEISERNSDQKHIDRAQKHITNLQGS